MRSLAGLVAVLGACYAPTLPAGAPCAANGECPAGLKCYQDRCWSEPPPDDADPDTTAPDDTMPDGAVDAMIDAPMAQAVTFGQAAFVDGNGVTTLTVPMPMSQPAGAWNIVFVTMFTSGGDIMTMTDTHGTSYSQIQGPPAGVFSVAMWAGRNPTAGMNSVTVTFTTMTAFPELRVAEYRGVAAVGAITTSKRATGSTATSTVTVTTTVANEMVVAGNAVELAGTTAPGTGWTNRQLTTNGHMIVDRMITTPMDATATATLNNPSPWVMSAVALKPGP